MTPAAGRKDSSKPTAKVLIISHLTKFLPDVFPL